jgi:predicted peptidase
MPTKPFCSLLAAAACLLPATAQDVKPDAVQQVRKFTRQITRTVSLDYLLFVPKAAAAQPDRKWPLILFLHGAGERGSDIWLVAKHGPPKIVREQPDFPFIVVSPQCPAGRVWDNDEVLALLDEILATQPVDPTRVYLTGLSMGGYGTWSLGLAHPERFAAIVPICGGGDPLKALLADPKKAGALRSLGVWAFHGAKDPVVRLVESERMVDALRKAGVREVELTVYPEAQHDSWTETYANPKLYEWLLRHQRTPAAE